MFYGVEFGEGVIHKYDDFDLKIDVPLEAYDFTPSDYYNDDSIVK